MHVLRAVGPPATRGRAHVHGPQPRPRRLTAPYRSVNAWLSADACGADPQPSKRSSTRYAMAAVMPAAGSVRIQAVTMLRATPHRTAFIRSDEPTPMIAELITWVVLTGTPICEAPKITVAAVVSAANPWTGSSFTTFVPIVLMIRQPPAAVPRLIALAAVRMTHSGTSKVSIWPALNRASVMMPIVFWASLLPWLNAM